MQIRLHKHLKPLTVILVITIICSWYRIYFQSLTPKEITPSDKPNLILNVELNQYDPVDGHLREHITGQKLYQYPKNHYRLVHVEIARHLANGQSWIIRSDEALSDNFTQKIELVGNVNIDITEEHTPDDTMHIRTEKLTLLPKSHQANTSAIVRISKNNATITGQGMQASEHSLNLTSNVEVHYAPNH